MKMFICLLLLAAASTANIHAQKEAVKISGNHFNHYVHIGYNIGALSPIPLPNNIRKIKGFNPLFNPSVGYEAVYKLNDHWGIGAGLRLDYKGMRAKDSVIYFHTIVTTNDGNQQAEFEGDFSGTNETFAHNGYVTLPVFALYEQGRWRYRLGAYFARMIRARFDGSVSDGYIRNGNSLGEKVLIERATFDFAETQRKFDWGAQAGAGYSFGSHWFATAQLNWGLRPVFPSEFKGISFKMYNIFLNVGAAYGF
jgi:hypothetical protein